jgi:hypothetical protein
MMLNDKHRTIFFNLHGYLWINFCMKFVLKKKIIYIINKFKKTNTYLFLLIMYKLTIFFQIKKFKKTNTYFLLIKYINIFETDVNS